MIQTQGLCSKVTRGPVLWGCSRLFDLADEEGTVLTDATFLYRHLPTNDGSECMEYRVSGCVLHKDHDRRCSFNVLGVCRCMGSSATDVPTYACIHPCIHAYTYMYIQTDIHT